MHSNTIYLTLTGCIFSTCIATPTPTQGGNNLERRDLLGLSLGNLVDNVNGILSSVDDILAGNTDSDDPYAALLDVLTPLKPTATPSSDEEASAAISEIFQASSRPENLVKAAAQLVAQGLTSDNVEGVLGKVGDILSGDNSERNNNPIDPTPTAFPTAGPSDAPFSLSEDDLRAAIRIPDSFQYGAEGAPQPIILVPGTGTTGFITFAGNLIPLLQGSDIADPVWLNIPGHLLGDVQIHAEYVAYAINYIYGISNERSVAVAAWSQGSIDAQWAYKYWPSTRDRVTDHIGFSPDYHGTSFANVLGIPGESLPPAILQQEYDSNFIRTLRGDGGDSSYVPTTSIYSGFLDEVVQPQSGLNASARLLDIRGVGASNNEVQVVCKGQLAGSVYTHEGTLYNPLGFALLKDALANNGTGEPSRLDLGSVCNDYLTPDLDLSDLLVTESAILFTAISITAYPDKTFDEPAIKDYAA